MSLFKTFPEIDKFFVSNKFTETELDMFIQEIDKKYNDKDLRKAALSFINLELAKFQVVKDHIDLNILKARKHNNNPQLNRPNEIQTLKNSSIKMIAEKLDLPLRKVANLLKMDSKLGLDQISNQILTSDEFNDAKEMILSRLKAIRRKEKQQKRENEGRVKSKKNRNSSNQRNDVYSKIEEIGLGKVIYIRKS